MTPARRSMRLMVRTHSRVLFEEDVTKIEAKAENGWFGMLPRHIDFVTALEPSVLTFEPLGKVPEYVAIDHGILVKCGRDVAVSTRSAVRGTNIAELKKQIELQFLIQREHERAARSLEAKLEAELVRSLLESEKNG